MKTLQDFLEACMKIDSCDVYDLFYDAPDDVREAVYDEAIRLGVVMEDEVEPTRASMIALGKANGIQSLIDY